uniref:Uncharacterized protein n=1 Tax=viral metagenome TaxID=1070528 RepID=A0A6C0ETM7_9ZZZZ
MIRARNNAFSCDVGAYFNGGVAYGKGNITPSYTQSGQYFNGGFVIPAVSFFSVTITFVTVFSSGPMVVATNTIIYYASCED